MGDRPADNRPGAAPVTSATLRGMVGWPVSTLFGLDEKTLWVFIIPLSCTWLLMPVWRGFGVISRNCLRRSF